MAMNTTVKYVLIGGGVALAVYIVAKKLMPDQPDKPTLGSGIGGIIDGAKDVWDVLSGKGAASSPATTGTATTTAPKGSGVQSPPTWNGGGGNADVPMTTQATGYFPPLGLPPLGSSPYASIAVGEPGAMPDALGTRRTERTLTQPAVYQTMAQRATGGDIRYSQYALKR